MQRFWIFFYNFLFVPIFYLIIKIASFFNLKISEGLKGRKNLFQNLSSQISKLSNNKKNIWFHSSSMGEFEQAKPIIEHLKLNFDINVVVTFFSPSGYNNSLRYPYADIISYLPFDTSSEAKLFFKLLNPCICVFMRYDIWPNFIWEADKLKIPIFIVDATMRNNSSRKYPVLKSFHKFFYKSITKILTVSDNDVQSFKDFDIPDHKLKKIGDTRFDRVFEKSLTAKEKKLFRENFFSGKKVFVFGSSWESDEEIVLPVLQKLISMDKNLVLIIAPHEPTIEHLDKLESYFYNKSTTVRFSFLNNYKGEQIIIVDSIGILLTLYFYADLAYVGGSFKQGIHNVLEPAVYGIPVIYGPKIQNSIEAIELEKEGGGFIVRTKANAYKTIKKLIYDEDYNSKAGIIASDFVHRNTGATKAIIAEFSVYLNSDKD